MPFSVSLKNISSHLNQIEQHSDLYAKDPKKADEALEELQGIGSELASAVNNEGPEGLQPGDMIAAQSVMNMISELTSRLSKQSSVGVANEEIKKIMKTRT